MTQSITIRHSGQIVTIPVSNSVKLWASHSDQPKALSQSQLTAAVRDALLHPIDYPPLTSGMVEGDCVAIVIDTEVPHPEAAIAGVIAAVETSFPERIDVVISDEASEPTQAAIARSLPEGVRLTVHRGHQRDELRYLAANEAADPIYLNRLIVDADLVIPILVPRQRDPLLRSAHSSPIFPSLSDTASQSRARTPLESKRASGSSNQEDEVAKVSWLLGLQWLVFVELNDDAEPFRVCAKSHDDFHASLETTPTSIAGSVVVACLDGNAQQQSICNLARAALNARTLANDDGYVVLVCDLSELGSIDERFSDEFGVEHTSSATWDAHESESMEPSEPQMAPTALEHARMTLHRIVNDDESNHRFLLWSNCNPDEVEAFGFGVVQDARSIQRLVESQSNVVVLRCAQLSSQVSKSERMHGQRAS